MSTSINGKVLNRKKVFNNWVNLRTLEVSTVPEENKPKFLAYFHPNYSKEL